MSPDGERRARVALSFLAKPGDPVLGAALRSRTASELLALVTDADGEALLAGEAEDVELHRSVQRWRDRLGEIPSTARLAAWQDRGLRLVIPAGAEWPTQLDDLSGARPLVLWLRGTADLRLTCVNSVAIVGSRAATGYGQHVAIELAAVLAEKGVGVISGGAYTTKSQLRAQRLCDLGRPVVPMRASRLGRVPMRRNASRFVLRASACHQFADSGAPRREPSVIDVQPDDLSAAGSCTTALARRNRTASLGHVEVTGRDDMPPGLHGPRAEAQRTEAVPGRQRSVAARGRRAAGRA